MYEFSALVFQRTPRAGIEEFLAVKNMSDNWLQLVPSDPHFCPSPERAESARKLLASFLPQSDQVLAEEKDAVEFFHPGGNWSGVECPVCGTDIEDWWEEVLDVAQEEGFENLVKVAGCCGAEVSLNELRYIWPAAFGRFALVAMNPNVENLAANQQAELEGELGCQLRTVWAHL